MLLALYLLFAQCQVQCDREGAMADPYAIVIDYVGKDGVTYGTTVGWGFDTRKQCEERGAELTKLHSDDEMRLRIVCIREDELHHYMTIPRLDS